MCLCAQHVSAHVRGIIIKLVFASVGTKLCKGRRENMIYMVEVLERMLMLAASRLSMIALEKQTEW